MRLLALRTDKPEAELYLIINEKVVAQKVWLAHRQLAETLNQEIENICKAHIEDQNNIDGVIFYNDGESFTGLRIGASVANAIAAALKIPIIGTSGDDWVKNGIVSLEAGTTKTGIFIDPNYSMPVHITKPKK